MDVHLHMLFVLVPILLPSLIPNLKYLAPFSSIANVCMATGVGVVFYYALQNIPDITERKYVGDLSTIPLFFGTAIYAFEGIALVTFAFCFYLVLIIIFFETIGATIKKCNEKPIKI